MTDHIARPTRRLFHAGRIAPRPSTCADGHLGPLIEQPHMTDWICGLLPDQPVTPQYRCMACGSDRGFTFEEVQRINGYPPRLGLAVVPEDGDPGA